jgi:hypothetical protein
MSATLSNVLNCSSQPGSATSAIDFRDVFDFSNVRDGEEA